MIHVIEKVELDVPVATAWEWLSDLERLVTVNEFHVTARFETEQRSGVGARMIVNHKFGYGPIFPRLTRITHWEAPKRIGWVEIDPAHPKLSFPHSQQFRLEPLPDDTTLLINELRGSLNSPVGNTLADATAQKMLVARVVRHECVYLKEQIEKFCSALKV
jgi:hypothetical protein